MLSQSAYSLIRLIRDDDSTKIPCLGDVFLNISFPVSDGGGDEVDGDMRRHICEMQVVHEKLYLVRNELNSHEDYEWLRSAAKVAEVRLKRADGEKGEARSLIGTAGGGICASRVASFCNASIGGGCRVSYCRWSVSIAGAEC